MAVKRRIDAFGDQARILATVDVGELWDRALGEFLGEWSRLQRTGMPPAEVEREMAAFMDNLSEKPLADVARQGSGVAYNQGRSAEILTANDSGEASFVVRSEVLDSNTCQACGTLDGIVVRVGTSEYFDLMPPARCEGGDRCRGFYIPVAA